MSPPINHEHDAAQRKFTFAWLSAAWDIYWQSSGVWIICTLLVGVVSAALWLLVAACTGQLHDMILLFTSHFKTAPAQNAASLHGIATSLLGEIPLNLVSFALYGVALAQIRSGVATTNDLGRVLPVWAPLLGIAFLQAVLSDIASVADSLIEQSPYWPSAGPANLGATTVYSMVVPYLTSLIMAFPSSLLLFAPLVALDRGTGFRESIAVSAGMVARDWLMAAVYVFVIGIVGGLGACACVIGLFVTVPLTYLSTAYGYTRLAAPFTPPGPDYGVAMPGVWPPPPNLNEPSAQEDNTHQS